MSEQTWKDWTKTRSGTSNASRKYLATVQIVERILRNQRIGDDPEQTARLIVSRLAHGQHFAPLRPPQEDR